MVAVEMPGPYASSVCETMDVRGLRYNIRRWGKRGGRPMLLVHGVQDSSISFQFMVEHLRDGWEIVAPDWRGHGYSQWSSQNYWFHEFVADLDVLADAMFPDRPFTLVGHSLGGNIAGVFAGVRPKRLTHLVTLDGIGPLVDAVPVDVLELMIRYLDGLRRDRDHAGYAGIEEVALRLQKGNGNLTAERAAFLAEQQTRVDPDGLRRWLFDPSLRRSLPTFHTIEEWFRMWSGISVPVLWVSSHDGRPNAPTNFPEEMKFRKARMPGVRHVDLPGTHHNLHHDVPETIARLIDDFVAGGAGGAADAGIEKHEYSSG